jgi:hypothetical protein
MAQLKTLLATAILVLPFLAGHQVALRAQCSYCYRNPGVGGTLDPYYVILGQCPCNTQIDCIYFQCECNGLEFGHSQCGVSPPPSSCIGC